MIIPIYLDEYCLRLIVLYCLFSLKKYVIDFRIRRTSENYKGTIGFIWWPSLVKKIEILKANYINNHVLLDWVRIHVSQHNMSCLIQLNFGSFVESSDISQIFTLLIFLFILQDICMMLNTYFQTSKLVSVVKSMLRLEEGYISA